MGSFLLLCQSISSVAIYRAVVCHPDPNVPGKGPIGFAQGWPAIAPLEAAAETCRFLGPTQGVGPRNDTPIWSTGTREMR